MTKLRQHRTAQHHAANAITISSIIGSTMRTTTTPDEATSFSFVSNVRWTHVRRTRGIVEFTPFVVSKLKPLPTTMTSCVQRTSCERSGAVVRNDADVVTTIKRGNLCVKGGGDKIGYMGGGGRGNNGEGSERMRDGWRKQGWRIGGGHGCG